MSMSQVYVATRTFESDDGDKFERGRRVAGDCPSIELHPDAFEPVARWEARERIRALASDLNVEGEPEPERSGRGTPSFNAAMRMFERSVHRDELPASAAERLEVALEGDHDGSASEYLLAVADPVYATAFGKVLQNPADAQLRFTREEQRAFQRVTEAQAARSILESSTGAYGVPLALDPTILLSSAGALNPVRQIARTISISTNEWVGVSSPGVSASYDAEGDEVSDDTPTLKQPKGYAERGTAFIPFSVEIGQDWSSLQSELGRLLQDAKDVLESEKFLTGVGHSGNEPEGFLVGGTVTVETAAATTIAVGDIYGLLEAVPARFQARARAVASATIWDKVYRLTPSGSTTEPQLMPDRGGALLGRPRHEWSDMPTELTSGASAIACGDWSNFAIFDRIGMSVEVVPHLVGASHRPVGQRGLFAIWRSGSAVLVPEAFRVLKVK